MAKNEAELQQLMFIRGTVASMPQEVQNKVQVAVKEIKGIIQAHGGEGFLALALVGAEVAAEVYPTPSDIINMATSNLASGDPK